ncbi:MAG: hypothetical protein KKH12_05745 [Gammaproteobacteria bacterium]|nr:hypothetical protein [Gammaproteobacteria bacterium]MBU1481164.1 hypothetical protein [Gammaproteobacteria bacterium]
MLNRFAKFLLVATSLSPILGAVAVNQYSLGKPMAMWLPWLVVALLLVFICWGLLHYSAKSAQKQTVRVAEFENNDKEVLSFLLAYLLPVLSSKDMAFDGQWMTGAYVIAVIFLVIVHAGIFHFNPVMGLLGYHFYGVKNSDGVAVLVISRPELRRPGIDVETVRLAHNIYLNTGEADA